MAGGDAATQNTTSPDIMEGLGPLEPFTNYSVAVRAVSSVLGEWSEAVNFTTLEDGEYFSGKGKMEGEGQAGGFLNSIPYNEQYLYFFFIVPTDVQNLAITDNGINLILSWEEPAELNGVVTYSVTYTCEGLFDSRIILNETVVVSDVSPIVISRSPHTLCTVTVTPQTGAGMGNSSTESFQTPEAGK